MTAWDIAVIGAGVAGSTAAALLAQRGLRVILLDKGSYPRQKVCGEFLSPEAVEVLCRVGVWPQIQVHYPPCIDSFTLTAGSHETRQKLSTPGYGVSRWLLDQTLWEHAQQAGVTTQEHCTVTQVTGDFHQGFCLTVQQAGSSSPHSGARSPVRRWPTVAAAWTDKHSSWRREVALCRLQSTLSGRVPRSTRRTPHHSSWVLRYGRGYRRGD